MQGEHRCCSAGIISEVMVSIQSERQINVIKVQKDDVVWFVIFQIKEIKFSN